MCGRFTLAADPRKLARAFDIPDVPELEPRYNVAPSQVVAVVGMKPDGRRRGLARLRWGLVPHWAQSPNAGPRPSNLRAESVAYKFGSLLRGRRCLIPADGFYEWVTEGKRKLPKRFTLLSGEPFGFAGVWDVWGEGPEKIVTCAVITTEANELVRPVHDRMPVIVPPERYAEWLDPGTPVDRLTALLRPYPAAEMAVADASPAVNSVRNDGPELLAA